MNAATEIKKICRQIVDNFHPQKVVLFGSYAYGKPTADSDVDLLVILPFTGRESTKAVEIRGKIKTVLPLDLLVKTPEKVRERIALDDFFMREITEQGKVLYETADAGVD
jgi:predicted nucleotidyltransferase